MTNTLTARDGSTYQATFDESTGTWSVADFPIFAVGRWHQIEFSAAVVDRLIDATERARKYVEPAIGIGHGAKGEDHSARPRFGKLGEIYRKGNMVFTKALRGIHDTVFQAIRTGMLGHPSVGLAKFSNPETRTQEMIFGYVDFTGIVPPEVMSLAPATDFARFGAGGAETVLTWDSFSPFASDMEEIKVVLAKPEEGKGEMSEELKELVDKLTAENTALRSQVGAADKAAKDAAAAREADRRMQFAAYVKSQIDMLIQEEYIKEGEKKAVQDACSALDPMNEAAFSSADTVVNAWKARGKQTPPNEGKPAGASGEPKGKSDERLFSAVVAVMNERKIASYSDAAAIVEAEQPELVKENNEQFACATANLRPNVRRYDA